MLWIRTGARETRDRPALPPIPSHIPSLCRAPRGEPGRPDTVIWGRTRSEARRPAGQAGHRARARLEILDLLSQGEKTVEHVAEHALVSGFWLWIAAATLLGVGIAMVYPTLLAAIGDVAHPSWRGSAVGVYRLWRDSGYAFGGLLAGVMADLYGDGMGSERWPCSPSRGACW